MIGGWFGTTEVVRKKSEWMVKMTKTIPQRLKPMVVLQGHSGTTKVVPFQNSGVVGVLRSL